MSTIKCEFVPQTVKMNKIVSVFVKLPSYSSPILKLFSRLYISGSLRPVRGNGVNPDTPAYALFGFR